MLTVGVGDAWGDEVYKTAKFGSAATSSTSVSNYTSASSATYSGYTVNTQNGNNNSNGWALIKFGPKPGKNESSPKTSTGTIATNSSIDKAITKVVVTGTGPISNTSITSTKLILASNSTFTSNKVEISGPTSFTNGTMTFTVGSPTTARYYKLEFNLSNGSSTNGAISISQVDYYIASIVTTVTADPTSIPFANNTLSNDEASGSSTIDLSVTNGNKSGGNYLWVMVESDNEDDCEFTINSGAYSYGSGNNTSIDDLSVEYYAISAGTWEGRVIAQGYNSSYTAVNCTIPLSVTVAAPACANSVTIATGSPTNCAISASAASVSTCSGTRQVTISVTPNSCYAAPVKASVTSTGTTATWVSGPTLNSDHYDYVYSFEDNATGTTTFNASLSTKTTYTVSYAAGTVPSGGGSITGSHVNDTKTCGTDLTLPEAVFTTTGYTQTGWSKTNGGSQYAAVGGSYTDDAAQTFYPVWTVKSYSVTWKVNNTTYSAGGSASVNHGSHIATLPTAPSPASYCGDVFVGWTTDENYVHNTSPLYTTASGFPTASGAQVFYAVFADYTTE